MKRDIINRVGALAVVLVVVVGGWWLYQNKIKGGQLDVPGINIFQNGEDENGPTGEPLTEEEVIGDQVEEDVAVKFNKEKDKVRAEVENYTDTYAKGTVSFSDEPAGAWWLAAKDKGGWKVVTSGNGDVMCREIAWYDFPKDMVSVCYDNATQQLRER